MNPRPDTPDTKRTGQQLRQRKLRDRSLVLVLLGTALFMPPMAAIFHVDTMIGGVPGIFVYIFAVWAVLIGGAFFLSTRLEATDGPTASYDGDGDPGP